MKEPIISRPELLARLNEIHNQLDKLEDVLHSSFLQQQVNVKKLQKERIDYCERKISQIEDKVMSKQGVTDGQASVQAIEPQNLKQSAGIQLELGIEAGL